MSTATSTLTALSVDDRLPVTPKSSSPSVPSSTSTHTPTSATLRSLYTRAARSFVLRDIPTTHSLLLSAFSLLHPPTSPTPDALADERRKWDILRITFESTVYTSAPASAATDDAFPEPLRAILAEPAQSLASSIYHRSLALFSPTTGTSQKPSLNAGFLPSQVLTTLVYCTLKLDAPDVGRIVIEDWIAWRDPDKVGQPNNDDGYAKVLELYTLHILPKLEQWDYAKEFLDYESELSVEARQHLQVSLKALHAQALAARRPLKASSLPHSESSTPRSHSPAPSSSSSSSSLSTTSTHTVVPSTATPRLGGNGLYRPSGLTSSSKARTGSAASTSSGSSNDTATPRGPNGHGHHLNGHANGNGLNGNGHLNGHGHGHKSRKDKQKQKANAGANGRSSSTSRTRTQTQTPSSSASVSSQNNRSLHSSYSNFGTTLNTHTHTLNTRPQTRTQALLHLIHTTLAPYLPPRVLAALDAALRTLAAPRVLVLVLMLVVVPVVSVVVRMRMRRRRALGGTVGSFGSLGSLGIGGAGLGAAGAVTLTHTQPTKSNADLVRRRLGSNAVGVGGVGSVVVGGGERGVVGRAWGEVVRVVGDTVKMAASGLV